MKTPTKAIIVPDWDALWDAMNADGVVRVEDMDRAGTQAFKMWCRKYQGCGIKVREDLAGGFQIAPGSGVGEKPRAVHEWDALLQEVVSTGRGKLANTANKRAAFRAHCVKLGYAPSFRAGFNGTCTVTLKEKKSV